MGADFIFACARVRGAERNLLGREKLGIMTEAKTMEDALKVLSEAQYGNEGEVTQPEAYERLLEQETTKLYDFMKEIAPGEEAFKIFSYPFDFVIGSVHLVNGKDPYYPVFFEGRKESTAYEEYFECCIQNLESYSNFDTFGHLDYIVRYGPNKNKYYSFERYQKYIDGILRRLIRYNIGLEVNTGGYKYGLGTTNPCREIVLRYRELGGTIITFGSDAHDPKYLTYEFEKAAELVRSCGFHSHYIFKDRKPVELPL